MLSYPPDLEQYVQAAIASGKFRSRDEFAVEAAKLFREVEGRYQQLKSDVQAALEEANAGKSEPLDIADIKRELANEIDISGRPQ
jgi:putative addiction module CopG family antidote